MLVYVYPFARALSEYKLSILDQVPSWFVFYHMLRDAKYDSFYGLLYADGVPISPKYSYRNVLTTNVIALSLFLHFS